MTMDLLIPLLAKSEKNTREIEQDIIIQTFTQTGCSLNVVNNYRENIVHVCASNNCNRLIELVLRRYGTKKADTKNKFGWTPLMQALREKHTETVELLINSGFHPNHRSYLGISTLSIAAAASVELFDYMYARYPTELRNTANDDFSPLCIAAMKNDKLLFNKILKLGVSLTTASAYTHFTMKNSNHEEIRAQANLRLAYDDYWENDEDNIQVNPNLGILFAAQTEIASDKKLNVPNIEVHPASSFNHSKRRQSNLQLFNINIENLDLAEEHILSPNLTYNRSGSYCMSPNRCYNNGKSFAKDKGGNGSSEQGANKPVLKNQQFQNQVPVWKHSAGFVRNLNKNFSSNSKAAHESIGHRSNNATVPEKSDEKKTSVRKEYSQFSSWRSPKENSKDLVAADQLLKRGRVFIRSSTLKSEADDFSAPTNKPQRKYEKHRPPNLEINKRTMEKTYFSKDNLNVTLGFTPEFNSIKSPNAPQESDDENVSGDKTPTPPRCSTPPTGFILTFSQNQLIRLLQAHRLDRHVPTFLEQEIELDLFSTLQDKDLIEIGISVESDRKELLKIIKTIKSKNNEF